MTIVERPASPDPTSHRAADEAPGRMAPAQLVRRRAFELAGRPGPGAALELVRTARCERSVLEHALVLAQPDRHAPDDAGRAVAAVAALEEALALLGGRDRRTTGRHLR